MLETIVPRLLDIHLKLCKFNKIPLKLIYPPEELYKEETALIIIGSCEELLRYGEAIEVSKLKGINLNLQNILQNITKFNSFECECRDTMRFLQLNAKAREGLANKMPDFEKAIEFTSAELQKTIDSIIDSHKEPRCWELRLGMKLKIIDLMNVFRKQRNDYRKFEECFGRLSKFLQIKLEIDQRRSFYMDEALNYLNGRTETFLSFLQESDNDYIRKTFRKHAGTREVKNMLRISLKEVMVKRGVKFEEDMNQRESENEQTEEQKKLKLDLKILTDDVAVLEENVTYFQNIDIPNGLKYLQQSQFNMQYYKRMLQQHEHLRL